MMDETKEELTKEDCLNIRKWMTATSMMIEARLRTTWTPSEQDTLEKIKRLEANKNVR